MKLKSKLFYNQRHVNEAMFRKNRNCIFLLVSCCLHLFTCDNKVPYRFLNSDISAYDFHMENGNLEEMMSITFLM